MGHRLRCHIFLTVCLGLLADACSFQNVDVAGSTLTVAPLRQQANGKTASEAVVMVRQQDGAVVSDAVVTVAGDTCTVTQTSTASDANGKATASITSSAAGACTISANVTIAGITQAIAQTAQVVFVAVPGPTQGFALIIENTQHWVAGGTLNPTLAAVDEFGNVTPTFVGTVQISSSDTKATLPTAATFTSANQGEVTLSGVTLRTSGTQKVNVVDLVTSTLNTVIQLQVEAGAAATLGFLNPPANIMPCATLTSLQVSVQDVYGNTVTTGAQAVTLSLVHATGGALLAGAVQQTTNNGVVSFTGVHLSHFTGSGITLKATATGISPASMTLPVVAAVLPSVTAVGPARGTGACVLIPYTVNSACPVSVEVDVDLHNTGAYVRATQGPAAASTQGVVGLQPGGTAAFTFVWDSARDLRNTSSTVNLRVVARSQDGNAAMATLSGLAVNNAQGQVCGWGFAAAQAVNTGQGSALASADINNDGRPDAVVVSASTSSVAVALGNGSGGFATPSTWSVGGGPGQPAVLDEDGDTHLDILVPCTTTKSLNLLRGDGSGNFTQATFSPQFNVPVAVDTADFNNDGIADIIVIDKTSGVWMLLGAGGGVYTTPIAYAANGGTVANAIGDVSGDGNMDVVVVNGAGAAVSVLLGNGAGALSLVSAQVATDTNATDIVLLDINSDGDLDIAVATPNNSVNFALGNGTGHFANVSKTGASGGAALAAADFTGDKKVDLIVTSNSQDNINLMINTGSSAFSSNNHLSHTHPYAIAVADVNGDGLPDFLYTSISGKNPDVLTAVISTGSGTFVQPSINTVAPSIKGLITADINNDGNIDAVAGSNNSNTISPFFGDGSGALNLQTTLSAGTTASVLATASLSNSAYPQVAVLDTAAFTLTSFLYKTASAALVQTGSQAMPSGATALALGDFTGDGVADAVEVNTGTDSIGISTGTSSATFAAAVTFALAAGSSGQAVATGDIDNNGTLDAVVAAQGTNVVTVLTGNGAGRLTVGASYAVPKAIDVLLADFNGDNKLDIAALDDTACTVHILKGLGTGAFTALAPLALNGCNNATAFLGQGDANVDGHIDLLVGYANAATLGIFLGDGTGAFPTSRYYITPADDSRPALADLNHDGRPDFLTTGFYFNNAVFVAMGN